MPHFPKKESGKNCTKTSVATNFPIFVIFSYFFVYIYYSSCLKHWKRSKRHISSLIGTDHLDGQSMYSYQTHSVITTHISQRESQRV